MTIQATGAASLSAQLTLFQENLDPIPIWILDVVPQVTFAVGVSVTTHASYSASVTATYSGGIGISNSGHNAWQSGQTSASADASESASISFYVKSPTVAFLVEGIAGPFITVKPEMVLSSTGTGWSVTPEIEIDGGLTANTELGISASVSWTLYTYSWPATTGALNPAVLVDDQESTIYTQNLYGGTYSVVNATSGDSVTIGTANSPKGTWINTYSGTVNSGGTYATGVTFSNSGRSSISFYVGAKDTTTGTWFPDWVLVVVQPTPLTPVLTTSSGTSISNNSKVNYYVSGIPGDSISVYYAASAAVLTSSLYSCPTCSGTLSASGTLTLSDTLVYTAFPASASGFYIEAKDTTDGYWAFPQWVLLQPSAPVNHLGKVAPWLEYIVPNCSNCPNTVLPQVLANGSNVQFLATGTVGDGFKVIETAHPSTTATVMSSVGGTLCNGPPCGPKYANFYSLAASRNFSTYWFAEEDTTTGVWSDWMNITIIPTLPLPELSVNSIPSTPGCWPQPLCVDSPFPSPGPITVGNNTNNTFDIAIPNAQFEWAARVYFSSVPNASGPVVFTCGTCTTGLENTGPNQVNSAAVWSPLYTGSSSFTFYAAAELLLPNIWGDFYPSGIWTNWVEIDIVPS